MAAKQVRTLEERLLIIEEVEKNHTEKRVDIANKQMKINNFFMKKV